MEERKIIFHVPEVTQNTSIIHWIGSLRKPGEDHLHLRFVKLGGMKCTNSVLLWHFGGLLWGAFVLWGFVEFFSCTRVK